MPFRRFGAHVALGLAVAFSATQPLRAADGPADELVVTATREAQKVGSTVQHTTVITEREIRASQAVDLPTLLRREAGIEYTQNGGVGRVGGLFMRGASPNQALILVDGVRINSATTGTTQIDQLMLDQIDRIEIVRGGGSSVYGSDAMGGVVQIFTRQGRGAPAPSVSVGLGNQGTQRYTAAFGGEVRDTRFNVNLSAFRTDGVSSLRPDASPFANPDDDGYRNTSSSASFTHFLSERHRFGASYFQTRGRSEFDNAFALARDDRQTGLADLSALSVFTQNQWTERWTSRLAYGQGTDSFKDYVNGSQTSRFKTDNDTFTWQNDFSLAPNHQLQAGLEFLRQQVSATTAYARTKRDVTSAFGGYRGVLGRHSLQGNVRYDDYSDFGGETSWLAGYGFQATDAVRLTVSQAHSFRAPSFNELFFPSFGNPNLQPETADTTELGAQYAAGAQLFRVALYRAKYKDLIGGFPIANVSDAKVDGIELSYTGRLADTELRASLTFQDPENETTGQQLIRRAKQFGSLSAARDFGRLRVGGEVVASGPRYDNDVYTFQRVELPGYAVVNLIARYALTSTVSLQLRVDNLFDKDYTLASGYNTQGRLVLFTVAYSPERP